MLMRLPSLTPANSFFAILTLFAGFWIVTGIALLLGAANLGTAMTFGQIAFAASATALLLFGN